MFKRRIQKHYVSPIDQKLATFDQSHSLTSTQQAENDKYQRIYRLRDVEKLEHLEEPSELWD